MSVDKQELRRLAADAIFGHWFKSGDLRYSNDKTGEVHGLNVEDDRFIAAATPAAIISLLDEIESLRDLLAEKVIDSTALTEFVANNGGAHLGMEGGACALFAHVFGQQLYESKAINYIEATFESPQHPDLGQITVTLKRESGKTPHQLRLQAEAELEQYRKDAERYRWLREQEAEEGIAVLNVTGWERAATCWALTYPDAELLDASIDAAMAKEQSQ